MSPTVILVGADKGGVGKTMTSRALLDYLAVHEVAVRPFDTQAPGGDLIRFAMNAALIDIGSVQDQMLVFDGVTADAVTVVDIRAGLLSPTIRALQEAHLLDDVATGAMRLVLLHVLGPTMTSIGEIAAASRTLGDARHLIVKNHVNAAKFFDWDQGPAQQILAKYSDVTIDMPQLAEIACEALQKRGGTFLSFIEDLKESRTLRGLVRTWLESVWAEFDRVNVLGLDPQPQTQTQGS